MSDRWQYLLVMAACIAVTLPLELFGARVYRRPRRWVLAVLPVAAVFLVWDAVAIGFDVWGYDFAYLTGWRLPFAIPVEEVVFFLVVPTCGLLTYEMVTLMLARIATWQRSRR
ncbi:lycopene cyclase domain-containing protein [Kribbella sp. NPDC020789]